MVLTTSHIGGGGGGGGLGGRRADARIDRGWQGMTAPIIEIDRVSKSFGSHQVLKELSFTVAPGEELALIGPSGSGKTTILRILMTLETINGGHVWEHGEQLYDMPSNGGVVPAD